MTAPSTSANGSALENTPNPSSAPKRTHEEPSEAQISIIPPVEKAGSESSGSGNPNHPIVPSNLQPLAKKRFTDNDKQRVLDMHSSGISNITISQELRMSLKTVAKYISQMSSESTSAKRKSESLSVAQSSAPTNNGRKFLSKAEKVSVVEMYKAGVLKTEIAQKIGMSVTSVSNVIAKYESEGLDALESSQKHYSDELIEQALEMRELGLPVKDISERLGMSTGSLYFLFRRHKETKIYDSDEDEAVTAALNVRKLKWDPIRGYCSTVVS